MNTFHDIPDTATLEQNLQTVHSARRQAVLEAADQHAQRLARRMFQPPLERLANRLAKRVAVRAAALCQRQLNRSPAQPLEDST